MTWQVIEADCVEQMKLMDEASVDAVVTDPPYGLHFMGKTWDQFGGPTGRDNTTHTERGGAMHAGKYDFSRNHEFQREMTSWAAECLRVLKPGGHLLAFGGTRTYHRLACAVEDAGFEIRDSVIWLYGSGFPKSLDVSKAIDRAAGAEREVVAPNPWLGRDPRGKQPHTSVFTDDNWVGRPDTERGVTAPATPEAQRWQGWGTALKPAHEPIVVARKPLVGTVSRNVAEFGTGALNIDGTRIQAQAGDREDYGLDGDEAAGIGYHGLDGRTAYERPAEGRWPANCVLSHLPECERVGERRVKGHAGYPNGPGGDKRADYREQRDETTFAPSYGGERDNEPWQGHADPDGLETVEAWSCAPGCPVAELDRQSGEQRSGIAGKRTDGVGMFGIPGHGEWGGYGDTGGASRFFATFYNEGGDMIRRCPTCGHAGARRDRVMVRADGEFAKEPAWRGAKPVPHDPKYVACPDRWHDDDDEPGLPRFRYVAKASRAERNAGLEGFEEQRGGGLQGTHDQSMLTGSGNERNPFGRNHHPTVKPVDLMRWLARLVTPPGGTVLDPFAGSGTTGIACVLEDFDFIGIEREPEYVEIARARIDYWARQPKQLGLLDAA